MELGDSRTRSWIEPAGCVWLVLIARPPRVAHVGRSPEEPDRSSRPGMVRELRSLRACSSSVCSAIDPPPTRYNRFPGAVTLSLRFRFGTCLRFQTRRTPRLVSRSDVSTPQATHPTVYHPARSSNVTSPPQKGQGSRRFRGKLIRFLHPVRPPHTRPPTHDRSRCRVRFRHDRCRCSTCSGRGSGHFHSRFRSRSRSGVPSGSSRSPGKAFARRRS